MIVQIIDLKASKHNIFNFEYIDGYKHQIEIQTETEGKALELLKEKIPSAKEIKRA